MSTVLETPPVEEITYREPEIRDNTWRTRDGIKENRGIYYFILLRKDASEHSLVSETLKVAGAVREKIRLFSRRNDVYAVLIIGSKVSNAHVEQMRSQLEESGFTIRDEYQEFDMKFTDDLQGDQVDLAPSYLDTSQSVDAAAC